jgi:hypothetical protein
MNKSKVVSHLIHEIQRRFHGACVKEIEKKLMSEGWSAGAIREALDASPWRAH